MKKTKFYSYSLNDITKGCKLCVKGAKLVLFVTGLCPRKCYFCPISEKKFQNDVVYADEWKTSNIKNIILEAKMINAEGAGITGGDPLCKLERTIKYIKILKKEFGKKFHIHLYTSFDLVNEKNLRKLFLSGLDEIRFHPDLDNEKLWNKISLANKFNWNVGVEIPVIPKMEKQIYKLVNYFSDKINFLNLNELEFAESKHNKLGEIGYVSKNYLSYGVKGSEILAIKLLKYIESKYSNLNVHYCTAKLKDKIQLSNRIKRRAKNAARPYDIITNEGLLYRGAIYTDNLNKVRTELIKKYKLNEKDIDVDKSRNRLLLSVKLIKKIKENYKKAIVEEYPTHDYFNVMTEFLN